MKRKIKITNALRAWLEAVFSNHFEIKQSYSAEDEEMLGQMGFTIEQVGLVAWQKK